MIAVGLGLLWMSYTLIWYGIAKIYSVDITLPDLVIPGRYDLCRWHDDMAKAKDVKASGGCPDAKQPNTQPPPPPPNKAPLT